MAPLTIETLDTGPVRAQTRSRWFFPAVSGVLLAGLVVGFAKTFFLRSLFDVRPLPPYLYVHGIVLTAWYALILAQTSLVAAHRTDLHRRLGVLAVGVAMAVVPLSTFVVVRAVPRMQGRDPATLCILVVGDLLMLVFFTGFVAAGV